MGISEPGLRMKQNLQIYLGLM